MATMKNVEYNGKTIKTNYEECAEYPYSNGDVRKGQFIVNAQYGESWKQLFDRCVERGFKSVRLVRVSTTVRGYTQSAAICKR